MLIIEGSSFVVSKYIDVNLTNLGTNISSSIGNFTVDVDDLLNKTKKMINEIDDIIQNLSDIHQEINQVEVYIKDYTYPLHYSSILFR